MTCGPSNWPARWWRWPISRLDDTVLDGPLVGLWSRSAQGQVFRAQPGVVEQLLERAGPFLSSESAELAENLRRERHWHYPPEALREALLNAFVHRDWTRPGEVELPAAAPRS